MIKFIRQLIKPERGLAEAKSLYESIRPTFIVKRNVNSIFSDFDYQIEEITIPANSTISRAIQMVNTYIHFEMIY